MSDLRKLAEQHTRGSALVSVRSDELLALLDERDRLRAALVEIEREPAGMDEGRIMRTIAWRALNPERFK